MPALPRPTKMRKITRKSQPGMKPSCPGVKYITPVASAIVIADRMKTVRRPMRSPSQPQKKAPRGGADARRQQDHAALQIGQRPLLCQRGGHIADQKEIEEIEQIGQVSRTDQLPLIFRKPLLAFQKLYHLRLPRQRHTSPPDRSSASVR